MATGLPKCRQAVRGGPDVTPAVDQPLHIYGNLLGEVAHEAFDHVPVIHCPFPQLEHAMIPGHFSYGHHVVL